MKRFAICLTLVGLLGLSGCSPSRLDRSAPTLPIAHLPVSDATETAAPAAPVPGDYGSLRLSIRWPERPAYGTSAIPITTNSLVIVVKKGPTPVIAPVILSREEGQALATTSIPLRAADNLSIEVKAYRESTPDLANDQPIAVGTGTANIVRSKVSSAKLTLGPLYVPAITALSTNRGGVGDTLTLTGTNFGSNAANVPIEVRFNGTPATQVTRTSETSLTVTVPPGATTGKVTVKADGIDSAANSNFVFWVANAVQTAPLTRESWDPSTGSHRYLLFGKTMAFRAATTWTFKDGESETTYGAAPASLTWSSSNETGGTIDAEGRFTAGTAAASTDVRASVGGVQSAAWTLTTVVVTGVQLNSSNVVLNVPAPMGHTSAGLPSSFAFTALASFSSPVTISGVSWSSSNPAIASVSQTGLVSALTPGKVTITAASLDDPSVSATASVTVENKGTIDVTID